ncbi:RraA family protein [Thermobacillus sp. ZCTH02-B1]|uniref:RraA family protein n=1 Tax=Thermobacillus sp. ZCTH02-B1 TaxID=1858795 RepID=UPI0025E18E68|nr:RraA family protein [Thermobacillus sp. ZCTH02-B1]
MTIPGFRILPMGRRPDPSLVKQFRKIATPLISDNMNRMHAISCELRPFHGGGRMAGTALTVKTRPGDNLMVHKAIDLAEPGDVIVVDAGGEMTHAIIGEIMVRLAVKKGLAGFVIDGCVRDTEAIREGDFPVFARGATHRGPYKDGPGEINVPVSVGGMVVHPGDIIVGDGDGLAVVPADIAQEILDLALAQKKREEAMFAAIEDGTIDRSWIDAVLIRKGCEWVGDSDKI